MLYPNFVQTNYTAVVDIGLQLANQTERYFNRWPNVCACNGTIPKESQYILIARGGLINVLTNPTLVWKSTNHM
jgi:hypothetical protein